MSAVIVVREPRGATRAVSSWPPSPLTTTTAPRPAPGPAQRVPLLIEVAATHERLGCGRLHGEPLGDREAPARVDADVADRIAPVAVLLVEIGERGDPPCRPEARLEMAHRALDRPLLARRLRRAGGGVEGVVATQVQKARVPVDDLALAPRNDRAQVVVDALADHAGANRRSARGPRETTRASCRSRSGQSARRSRAATRPARRRGARDRRSSGSLASRSSRAGAPGRGGSRCAGRDAQPAGAVAAGAGARGRPSPRSRSRRAGSRSPAVP